MGELSPDTVAFWLARDTSNADYRPLLDVTTEVLASHMPAKSPEERAEIAESLLPTVVSALERLALESREDGVEPAFQLSPEDQTYYIRAVSTVTAQVVDELLLLSPSEFEQFCARVLERMGGRCTVTGRGGDGGVDFVARNLSLHTPAPIGARVLVVGQAKRYARENLIAENELRSFVGSAIRRTSDPEDATCFRREILAPVAFAFWTTSDFQPSARKFARSVGLWYLNGPALAQLAMKLGIQPGIQPGS